MSIAWILHRRSRWTGPCVLALVVGLGPVRAQNPAPSASERQEAHQAGDRPASAALRDEAEMFGPETRARVRETLERIEKQHHVPIRIETIESLEGEAIAAEAPSRARRSGGTGIYILLSRKETKLQILVSRDFRDRIPQPAIQEIRDTFLAGFRAGDFDQGLIRGVQAIDTSLAQAHEARPPADASSLVARDQVRLTLAGARRVIAGAEAKAAEMGLKVNVMVVDDGGHPLAFARMDGARPASAYTATTKAISAATFRQATGPIPPGIDPPDPLLNLSLQNAATAGGGKLTTLFGGLPVVVQEQVIGGVGVGGGTGEQDAEVARAGVAAFLDGLRGATAEDRAAADSR